MTTSYPKPSPSMLANSRPAPSKQFKPFAFAIRAVISVPRLNRAALTEQALRMAERKGRPIDPTSPMLNQWQAQWLIHEGSNLNEHLSRVGGDERAVALLVRRTMAHITWIYPHLKKTMNRLIRTQYPPNPKYPVCLPTNLRVIQNEVEAQLRKNGSFSEAKLNSSVLRRVLLEQTDYQRLLNDLTSTKDKELLEARCLLSISYTFPPLFTVAQKRAEYLRGRNRWNNSRQGAKRNAVPSSQ